MLFNNADQISSVVTPVPASGQSSQVTTNYFDSLGRIWKTTLPDNTSVTNEFYPTGHLKRNYGSRAYPVGYGYDSQGRLTKMTNWTSFASGAGARITTWNYDGYTGFLTNKVYAGNAAGPSYTYTGSGKLQTRLWARGTNTTYAYNSAGDLAAVSYNDGSTPAVTNTYDRRGRLSSVTWGTNVCSLVYDAAGNLLSETYSGGLLNGLTVTNVFDSLLRGATNGLFNGSAWLAQTRYAYDAASRLQTVTDGTNYATYAYVTNSPLVGQLWFTNNGVLRMTTSKSYDLLNRLTQISSVPSASSAVTFNYSYNSANQRTAFTNADNSKWVFGYDNLGQVTSGRKYWSDGTYVAGQQFTYGFDDIGNRTNAGFGGDPSGLNLRSAPYYANALNQYTNRTVPGYFEVLGTANSNANVLIQSAWGPIPGWQSWDGLPYRKGEYFWAESPLDNAGTAVRLTVTTIAALPGVTNADLQTNVTGSVFVPQTPEQYRYDADGNLYSDGHWTYTWDAENRLVGLAVNLAGLPAQALKFEYDWRGRRSHKQVWDNATRTGSPTNDVKFLYDGWNLIGELSATNSVIQTYLWGTDLSGTGQGAGGVGGLLAVKDTLQGTHFVAFDGNGNVAALVKAADGTASANYEYGPFGEVLRATGPMARFSPLRFSTKYQDDETDLVYYPPGRYYIPSRGDWASRDPIGENGGLNLYGFVGNDSVDSIDLLGLIDFAPGVELPPTVSTPRLVPTAPTLPDGRTAPLEPPDVQTLPVARPPSVRPGWLSPLGLGVGIFFASTQTLNGGEEEELQRIRSYGVVQAYENELSKQENDKSKLNAMRVQLQLGPKQVWSIQERAHFPGAAYNTERIGVLKVQLHLRLFKMSQDVLAGKTDFPIGSFSRLQSAIIESSQKILASPPIGPQAGEVRSLRTYFQDDAGCAYRIDVQNLRGVNLRR